MEALKTRRAELVLALRLCDQDGFPGSRAYKTMVAAERALADFDTAHPELASSSIELSDGAARAIRGED